jgi:hypothetical protein
MVTGPSQMPVLELVRALTKSNYQVSPAPVLQVDGVPATHVKISDQTDVITQSVTAQDWYFDPKSGLPLRWEFLVPDTLNASSSAFAGAKEFANYQNANGILLPAQTTYFRDGRAASIVTLTSVQLNIPVPESTFNLPTEAD